MNMKASFLLAVTLCAAPFASAQLTLHDFTQFESPNAYFMGDWALNEPSGDLSPLATFSQGAGIYNFVGGTNADTSGAFFFYNTPLHITGLNTLQITGKRLTGSTADTFTVALYDSSNESAFAVFSLADFSSTDFIGVAADLTYTPGFNQADLSSFQITGGIVNGTHALNISLDHLAATAIPEPSTYSLLGGLLVLGLAIVRRLRR